MSDTGATGGYEQQDAQDRQQSKQELDQSASDFERTSQEGSLEEIIQWKEHFQQLAQMYAEAAQSDPNEQNRQAWMTAAENMDYAAQTLTAIDGVDTSGLTDSLNNANGSMQNVTGERDDEDDERKATLRDHRQRATETTGKLDQLSNQASNPKGLRRREAEQMRNDIRELHQNTQWNASEHRNADEQAG